MKIEILSTGNEVMSGDIADTNAAFLCAAFRDMGLQVQQTTALPDDLETIAQGLEMISTRADLCIVTGGLGPTSDDVTAAACARACHQKLIKNKGALASIKSYFKKRGFEFSKINEKQAWFPETADILVNESGTAPGFYLLFDPCLFIFLPGVPSEMKKMFAGQGVPLIRSHFNITSSFQRKCLTVFGLGESKVAELLDGFESEFDGITIGYRVNFPLIEVKLAAQSNDKKKPPDMQGAYDWVMARIGGRVISDQGLDMAQEAGRLLVEKNKTLAVAESCTGGLISSMMTDVPGSSDYFLFSGVTYSNDAKINVLGVKKETILQFGAVDEHTAKEMALGAMRAAGADFGISTTGIAGPSGGTKDKPVGMVCIGLATQDSCTAKTYRFSIPDRLMNKQMFAACALEQLRRHLTAL